jgi:hypothetical protein
MGEQILNAFGDRLTTAIVLSAAVALAIVAIVALAWWWGRRWARNRADAWSTGRISMGGRMTESRVNEPAASTAPEPSADAGAPTGEEQWGSRLIRDTAARAAALRDTWDRSYSAARTGAAGRAADQPDPAPAGPAPAGPAPAGPDRLIEIIAEQRRTNALLSEVLAELRKGR